MEFNLGRNYSAFPQSQHHRLFNRIQHEPNSGCWLWDGALSRDGYALVGSYTKGSGVRQQWYAHRVMYVLERGDVPSNLHLDHLCRTRCCVNPHHLEPVTARENIARSPLFNGAKTHCPLGHEYTEANTKWQISKGKYKTRACRTCMYAKNKQWRDNRTKDQRQARLAKLRLKRRGPEYAATVKAYKERRKAREAAHI